MRTFFIAVLLVLLYNFIVAQPVSIGVPFVKNFKPEMYNAADQNWNIVQDQQGMMYFANNNGILCYNGTNWQIAGIASNLSAIHGLAIDKQGRIFAGGYADIGILKKDKSGNFSWSSLINKIPPQYRKFDYIWNIIPMRRGTVFQSTYMSFYYVDDSIEVINHPVESIKAFYVEDRLFVLFKDALREISDGKLIDIPLGPSFAPLNVAFMLPFENNTILVGSESDGLYIYDFKKIVPYKTSIDEFLRKNKLYCGITTRNNQIALGTLHAGLVLIDKSGKMIYNLNTDNGLQNNTVLNIKSDNIGNLWVTMDQGIDYIETASPFTRIPSQKLNGYIYSMVNYKGKLFVATHHGLMYKDWKNIEQINDNNEFSTFPGISEINWSLTVIDDKLFLGHDKGTYIINNNSAQMISNVKGGWCHKLLKHHKDVIVGGTYKALVIYKKKNGNWYQFKVLPDLNESCRIIEEDKNGYLWVTSGYYGVYKVALSENADSITSVEFYDSSKGFPKSLFFGINKINNEIVFGTQAGAFSYNEETNRMEPHKVLFQILKDSHVRKLVQTFDNQVWYVVGDNTGILKYMGDGTIDQVTVPFQKIADNHVPGFENMFFANKNHTFFGTKHGIIIYNSGSTRDYYQKFYTVIEKVFIQGPRDSIICQNLIQKSIDEKVEIPEINYKNNKLHFIFSALFYENPKEITYKYMLEGFDDDWSSWTNKNEKEYTNIPEGTYTFRVKSKNIYGIESEETLMRFVVLAPWYRTKWAIMLYIITIGGAFIFFLKYKNRKFAHEKMLLEQENEKNLRLKTAEHEKEKLEEELKSRQKELASATMNIAQKNEKFLEIKEKLLTIDVQSDKEKRKINSLVKILDDEINDESYWEQFEMHFNLLNDNFLKKLQKEFPNLTHKDLKMCAFLRMNLSNKEIASLLNITLRGVEASRLRLRRKLKLEKDSPLTEFIIHF
ncbi:MAG TPA: triple tyrosine motif-containing protein [Bacteroidales bacterium]|nr:triple tyrosine motif-containing protein [Bacteroidales bacterium]